MTLDRDGRRRFTVDVTPAELARFAPGLAEPEPLVRASFAFLLERESPASILPRFGLATIERYFPEYPDRIARYLATG